MRFGSFDLDHSARQAVAEAIAQRFGFEDDASYDFLDEGSNPDLINFEVEADLSDSFVDSELEDLWFEAEENEEDWIDDDEDDENLSGSSSDGDEMFGRLSPPPDLSGRIASSAEARAAFGDSLRPSFGQDASSPVSSQAAFGGSVIQPSASSSVPSFESGPDALPPVYVADPVTASSISVKTPSQSLSLETSFGATADRGIVSSQPRPRAKKAAQNAVFRGAQGLASVPYRQGQPFVEDPFASPSLLSDGRVIDSIHGDLSVVPCPSCARVARPVVYGTTSVDCPVCDGFGSLLVPEGDLPSYVGSSTYGFVQFLVAPLAKLAATGVSRSEKRKAAESTAAHAKKAEVKARLIAKMNASDADASASSGAQGSDDVDGDDDEFELDEDFGLDDDEDEGDDDLFGFDDVLGEIDDDADNLEDFGDIDYDFDAVIDDAFGDSEDEGDEDDEDDEDDEEASSVQPSGSSWLLSRALLISEAS